MRRHKKRERFLEVSLAGVGVGRWERKRQENRVFVSSCSGERPSLGSANKLVSAT